MNGVYAFTGNFINGRNLYVKEDKMFGIWFNGKSGGAADWVIGWMSALAEGNGYSWAQNNRDLSCPSLSKEWDEFWNNQWQYSQKGVVQCVSGCK